MTPLPLLEKTPSAVASGPVDAAAAETREAALLATLAGLGECVVAFSAGVDSTYLAWAARLALGDRATAFTALSPSVPAAVREESRRLAAFIGIRHQIIETGEVDDPRYRRNLADRCYWCKSELYGRLGALAPRPGVVIDGTNRDDLADVRPGRRAAAEHGVRSPLVEAGLGKADIRHLSRRAGLPTWDRPASPCLSSRVPHGSPIDAEMLAAIDRAEEAVRGLGFREFRVRHHGAVARLEIARSEWGRAADPDVAIDLAAAVKAAGFAFVAIDLEPFRSGRLSEAGRLERAG